ncbi:MAG: hypothetical protein KIT16_07355 [Rhodospirillaceae bacterium]|nr:hypothetical protein [Rhodospirillaceae bacterium]
MGGEAQEPEEEPSRFGAFAVLGVAAIIVAGGYWLVTDLMEANRYAKCAAARHRNCDRLDYYNPPATRP